MPAYTRVLYGDGALAQFWDDLGIAGAPRTYHEYDEAGAEKRSRPFTADENAEADARAVAAVALANGTSIRADVRAQIDALKALIGSTADPAGTNTLRAIRATPNSTINAGPAPYIQALTKALIDVVQAEVRISRLLVGALDDTSTAPQVAGQQ